MPVWGGRPDHSPDHSDALSGAGRALHSGRPEHDHPLDAAVTLALSHALVVGSFGQSDRVDAARGCLYGVANAYTGELLDTPEKLARHQQAHPGIGTTPVIPGKASWIGMVQSLLSLIAIFFFLLAARNRFRVG